MERQRRARRRRIFAFVTATILAIAVVGAGAYALTRTQGDANDQVASGGSTTSTIPTTTTTTKPPYTGWVDPESAFRPFPKAKVEGLLTFRGNPTRNYYGQGPMPVAPHVVWKYPGEQMCRLSEDKGETTRWCGNGWTGQPAVFERDGRTWVVFGAYDGAVHFVDAATGQDILPPFQTGRHHQGFGERRPRGAPADLHRVARQLLPCAGDRPAGRRPSCGSSARMPCRPVKWNNDWDGSGLVLGDYLFEGGENSQIHIVKLNRAVGPDGLVAIAPELIWHAPGWDDELISAVGSEVSIENSVAVSGNTLYFGNSGGLIQGWDIGPILAGTGEPTRVFRFWTGDDSDASVVVDEAGQLYGGSEWERHNAQSAAVGQMWKLNPAQPDNPLVWTQHDQGAEKAGVWGTPGIVGDLAIYTTYTGRAVGLDRNTGAIRWEKHLPAPLMGSPVDRRRRVAAG